MWWLRGSADEAPEWPLGQEKGKKPLPGDEHCVGADRDAERPLMRTGNSSFKGEKRMSLLGPAIV